MHTEIKSKFSSKWDKFINHFRNYWVSTVFCQKKLLSKLHEIIWGFDEIILLPTESVTEQLSFSNFHHRWHKSAVLVVSSLSPNAIAEVTGQYSFNLIITRDFDHYIVFIQPIKTSYFFCRWLSCVFKL